MSQKNDGKSEKGFGFGLGKVKELTEAFKKAQVVQEGAKKLQEELEQLAVTNASVKRFIEGKNIQKIIVVPKRLVNIVAK